MHDLLRVGDIGFSPDELPRLEPYLPAAVGLALGGAGVGTVVNLQPRTRRTAKRTRPTISPKIGAGVAAAVVLLGGLTYMEHSKAASAKSKRDDVQTEAVKLRNQLGHLTAAGSPTGQAASLQQQAATILGQDVSWTDALHDLGVALPNGVRLTTFQAQRDVVVAETKKSSTSSSTTSSSSGSGPISKSKSTASDASSAATSTANRAGSSDPTSSSRTGAGVGAATATLGTAACTSYEVPLAGSVTMAGFAPDLPAVASFLDALTALGGKDTPDFTGVTLTQVQKSTVAEHDIVVFTIDATLASGVRSDRLQHFFEGALCK
jgi:hypothetical protein